MIKKISKDDSQRYLVQSIEKSLDVMEVLAEHDSLNLVEMAEMLSQPKSSLYRIILTLKSRGFIDRNDEDGKYRIGYKQLNITRKLLEKNSLRNASLEEMNKLVKLHGDTVNLSGISNEKISYLEIVDGTYSLRMTDTVGANCALHATAMGKAIAAYLPKEEVDHILRKNGMQKYTPNTIVDPQQLYKELQRVHEQKYALDYEEIAQGARCIASPIFNVLGNVIGAISISGAVHRFSTDKITVIASDVVNAAKNISAILGFSEENKQI